MSPDLSDGCNIAREVLLARIISMIMPLQSQHMLIIGPRAVWGVPAALAPLEEGFLVGSVMDWERCKGRFPFCWSTTEVLARPALGVADEGVEEEEGGAVDGAPVLSGSEK